MVKGLYHSHKGIDISMIDLSILKGIIHVYSYMIKGLYHSIYGISTSTIYFEYIIGICITFLRVLISVHYL